MSESLKAAAYAAGLSEQDKRKIDNLSKALTVHKNLLAMPAEAANAVYKSLPQNQQQNLVQNFGEETPEEKPKQGWLGTANHYTGYQAYKALNFLADRVTQTYRAAVIPIVERGEIGFAWDEAGKDGEKVITQVVLKQPLNNMAKLKLRLPKKLAKVQI